MDSATVTSSDLDTEIELRLSACIPCNEEAKAVNCAVQKALDIVKRYSEVDATTDPAWKNPDAIYQQLDQARHDIAHAWTALHAAVRATPDRHEVAATTASTSTSSSSNKDEIRTAYMDMITDAFADVLENMRQKSETSNDPLDVELLVDCLQSGLDLLYMNSSIQIAGEADFLWNDYESFNDDTEIGMYDDDNDEAAYMTPHELRRRELGYHVEESTA